MQSEFPTNSRKAAKPAKDEPKKVEKVVVGQVERRKKPLTKRISETFLGGDPKSVMGYVVTDVLVPAAKDMIADAVSQGVEKMVFGEARSSSRRTGHRPSGGSTYTSYNRYGPQPLGSRMAEELRPALSRKARATHNSPQGPKRRRSSTVSSTSSRGTTPRPSRTCTTSWAPQAASPTASGGGQTSAAPASPEFVTDICSTSPAPNRSTDGSANSNTIRRIS